MTWKTMFTKRSTTRRRSSKRTPMSSRDLSRSLGFRPYLECLENRLAPAQLTLTSNLPDPTLYGQQVTIIGSGASANEAAGAIQLTENGSALTPAAANSAAADGSGNFTITYSALAAGTHTLVISDGGTNTDSASFSQEVDLGTTSTSDVSSSANSVAFGVPVTLSTTVTSTVAGGSGVPTGTVAFDDGTTLVGSGALNSSGVATFAESALAPGNHTLTANYGGDLNFSGSNDTASGTKLVETISGQATTSMMVTGPTGTNFFGNKVTFTATVTNTSAGSVATPTGSVTFTIKSGSTILATGPGTLNSSGVATFAASNLAGGTVTTTASYAGNTSFAASGPGSATTVITPAATTLTIQVGSTTLPFSQNYAINAIVRAKAGFGSGTPGNTASLGANAGGVVNFQAIATTNADAGNNFLLGGTFTIPLGSFPVNSTGVATLGSPALLPGVLTVYNNAGGVAGLLSVTYTITGTFVGTGGASADFASNLSADTTTANRTFTQAGSQTTLIVKPTSSPQFGQAVTLTAVVGAVPGGNVAPLGTVTFNDTINGVTTPLATVTLPPSQLKGRTAELVTFSTKALAKGAHTITALYNSHPAATAPNFTNTANPFTTLPNPIDGQWTTSTSAGSSVTVAADNTVGTLTANPAGGTTTHGQTATFTDTVTSSFNNPVSGLVQFKVDGVIVASTSLTAFGPNSARATYTTNSLSVGSHTISAVYNAHLNFLGDTSNAVTYSVAAIVLGPNTAPSAPQGSIAFAENSTPAAKSTGPGTSNPDGNSTSPATPNSSRTLAGSLAKVRSSDDWLGGPF
jgi:Bacterial Ig-like domain (group 3)